MAWQCWFRHLMVPEPAADVWLDPLDHMLKCLRCGTTRLAVRRRLE